jgi:hypothetical protein
VTDSQTGQGKFYRNLQGNPSRTVTDTAALAVCP